MILSYEMPAVTSVTVNQGSLVSASAVDLYDGRPGTPVVFQTPSSTGTTLRFTLALASSIATSSLDYLFIRIDNVRGNAWPNPPQVAVTLTGPGTAFSAAAVVLGPMGEYSGRTILVPRSAFGPGFAAITAVQVDITNQVGSSQVSVGDVFVSRAYHAPAAKIVDVPIDPIEMRRSDGNQAWPIFRLPFRRVSAEFGTVSYRDAFVDSTLWPVPGNLRNLITAAARAPKVGLITRWRYDRDAAASQTMIDQNAMLANVVEISGLEAVAAVDRPAPVVVFEERL